MKTRQGFLTLAPLAALLCLGAFALRAGDAAVQTDEKRMKLANACAENGDYQNAISIYFNILGHSDNNDARNNARGGLEKLGFTSQEIFQLEPVKLKAEELEKILERTAATVVQHQRRQMDLDYARQLLNTAVSWRLSVSGQLQMEVHNKDLVQAMDMLLAIALGNDEARAHEAQGLLENFGVRGERANAVKAALLTGTLPEAIQNELVATTCLTSLKQYRDWMQEDPNSEDHDIHEHVAKQVGIALFKYMEKHFAGAAVMKQQTEARDFWRGNTPGDF